jgi:transaldolase
MTASPAVFIAPSAASAVPASLEWLDHDLRQRLTQAAGIAGMDATEACAQWVREGLERFEAEQAAMEQALPGQVGAAL